jgi:type III restriction enzyme
MAESSDDSFYADGGETASEDENEPRKMTRKEQAEDLRRKVDTIGQVGKPGEQIQNVISVGMLSEGWDAKTVTHIMGLRAFTSQLLCEQVVGRGLRRTSYEINADTGLFDAEYVNIFGVPFTFLPYESHDEHIPQPPAPKFRIEPDEKKKQFEISWPNVIRVDYEYKPVLSLDIDKVKTLVLDANETKLIADMAPVVEGKPDVTKVTSISRKPRRKVQDAKADLRDVKGRLRRDQAELEGQQGILALAAHLPGRQVHQVR